jgi:SSS family transporter
MGNALLSICVLLCATLAHGAEITSEQVQWRSLPALPQKLSGQFAGASGGALLVIGGTDFPTSLFEGGQKVWYDTVYVLEPGKEEWVAALKLDHPLAYGASITIDDSVVCIGGSSGKQHHAEVFRLRWIDGHIVRTPLPSLPQPLAMMGATALGNTIYVAGGQRDPQSTGALADLWSLDLSQRTPQWQSLGPIPGKGRILPVVAAQGGAVYVISGAQLSAGADGKVVRNYLSDGYRFQPGRGWSRIAAVPHPVVAAPAAPYGQSHILVYGGDDGVHAQQVMELREDHPGFNRDVLAYHTITNTWVKIGQMPAGLVTTQAVLWGSQTVIPGGEDRPGHRSAEVLSGQLALWRRPFGLINYAVLIAYLGANLLVGVYFTRRQKNTNDFFLAGQRISWWAAGIAIFGTQLSSITFMAIPAKTFAADWTYILANVAIVLITPIVVFFYLPFFRRLQITSAYEYLEKRFNLAVRLFGSATFVLMQTGRMAIILYLPALALSVISDLNIYICILTMGVVSTLYTMLGGAEAVTWTEVLQFFVLIGSAVLTLALVAGSITGGVDALAITALSEGKLKAFEWGWDYTTTTVWVVLIGNIFAQLVPYTTDQAVIQRYLTTPSEKEAAQSIWLNAMFVIPASLIFFSIGTALYVFYKQNPQLININMQTDAIFPWFILSQMPVGVSGLVIAGLFAAGQSGSQNSVATAIVTDFYQRFRPHASERHCLRLARKLTLILGIIGISCAALMATFDIESLWDLFLTILGLLGGGLAGVFMLGIFTKRASGGGALVGVVTSWVVLYLVQSYTSVHFFLYAGIGIIVCVISGYIASRVMPADRRNLEGLTIFTSGRPEVSLNKAEAAKA